MYYHHCKFSTRHVALPCRRISAPFTHLPYIMVLSSTLHPNASPCYAEPRLTHNATTYSVNDHQILIAEVMQLKILHSRRSKDAPVNSPRPQRGWQCTCPPLHPGAAIRNKLDQKPQVMAIKLDEDVGLALLFNKLQCISFPR